MLKVSDGYHGTIDTDTHTHKLRTCYSESHPVGGVGLQHLVDGCHGAVVGRGEGCDQWGRRVAEQDTCTHRHGV